MSVQYVVILALIVSSARAWGQDWTQFRGPDGQGHSTVKRLPLSWSDDSKNIAWKVAIDGLGWSSPTIKGGRVWLTSATDEGKSLRAICLDLKAGSTVHEVEVFKRDSALNIHKKNSHASPTPFIEGNRVYVHFGTYGTACLTTDGKVLWRREIKYSHVHGPGGSPVIHHDLLLFSCDGGDAQFVVALDKETGDIRWQTERPDNPDGKKFAFCTPLIIEANGKTQAISPGAGSVVSYDPATGKEIWHVNYPQGYSVVPRPIYSNGLIFLSTGYERPRLLAIRPDGIGDATETHVEWSFERGAPHNPSPLAVGDEIYLVSDGGVATCLDAKTGEQHWQKRLGGSFSASPLFAAGRIYFLDEAGTTVVIQPGKEYKELQRNQIKGQTLASLVPTEGAMLLRTGTHLFRIDAD